VDFQSYVNYIKKEENILQKREIVKKFSLDMLNLTEKQKEILNIYSKIRSMSQTAEILGVAKSTVQVTIERIRKKAVAVCGAMEF
jgi:DNA-directed RNA polymerase specialized sigma subunit